MDLESEHTSYLKSIYILSLILEHGGIELFFEKKVNLTPVDLTEQHLFVKIHRDTNLKEMIHEL
jgi:hypothetical protein